MRFESGRAPGDVGQPVDLEPPDAPGEAKPDGVDQVAVVHRALGKDATGTCRKKKLKTDSSDFKN